MTTAPNIRLPNLDALGDVAGSPLTDARLNLLLAEHERLTVPKLRLLWTYYRNRLDLRPAGLFGRADSSNPRGYRLAQERGLPGRITGSSRGTVLSDDRAAGATGTGIANTFGSRREVVIENDIAWRIHAMVDFLFSRTVRLVSMADDPRTRSLIQRVLDIVFEASGGAPLLQDMALLGHVYGHVDLAVRAPEDLGSARRGSGPGATQGAGNDESAIRTLAAARRLRIELIEPTRGVAVLDPRDYRAVAGYVIRSVRDGGPVPSDPTRRRLIVVTEVLSASGRHVYEHDLDPGAGGAGDVKSARDAARLVDESPNTVCPGVVPIVHIQNISQPFAYAGLSDVEPLIPLQDELNTRMSDRACRVTLQSFKMYLAKGLEGFEKSPIGPGMVWSTDNPDSSISEFGGDASSPSEEQHIAQVRDALDKASSLPPLATGVVQAKVGNLTSENALRLTLGGVLTRTNRKRLLYGRGIGEACRLVLCALDHAGVLRTSEDDRRVRVEWSDPLPQTPADALQAARSKIDLGIDAEQVKTELGYGTADEGVV